MTLSPEQIAELKALADALNGPITPAWQEQFISRQSRLAVAVPALIEALAAMTRERDGWREAKRKLEAEHYEHPWTVNEAARERMRADALQSSNARLKAALEPFVREAERVDPNGPHESIDDSCEIWQCGDFRITRSKITYGDLRRAREALSPAPRTEGEAKPTEAELADLIARYYRRKIGVLMQQAEHWAEHNKPLAVHHRLHMADAYFQIVALCERFAQWGENPFDTMRSELSREPIKSLGTYPPSPELHRYRDPNFVAKALGSPSPDREIAEELVRELRLARNWMPNQFKGDPHFDARIAAIEAVLARAAGIGEEK